jgi:hypothetical protein
MFMIRKSLSRPLLGGFMLCLMGSSYASGTIKPTTLIIKKYSLTVDGKPINNGAMRDTILLLPKSTVKVQFDSDNPGN